MAVYNSTDIANILATLEEETGTELGDKIMRKVKRGNFMFRKESNRLQEFFILYNLVTIDCNPNSTVDSFDKFLFIDRLQDLREGCGIPTTTTTTTTTTTNHILTEDGKKLLTEDGNNITLE